MFRARPRPSYPRRSAVRPRRPAFETRWIYYRPRQTVVDAMLKVANVKAGDVVYDLGCGAGRIPVSAAKLGARAVCIDIDPKRVAEANENVKKNAVGDRVRVLNQDLFTTDLGEASVVTLSGSVANSARPTLWKTLKPGTRIVSHDFSIWRWKPSDVETWTRAVDVWTSRRNLRRKRPETNNSSS